MCFNVYRPPHRNNLNAFFEEITVPLKGTEATCVEMTTEMKKCFRLKDMLSFNIP